VAHEHPVCHGEAQRGGVSSLASSLASDAANSIKFGNERMIRAKHGLYTAALSAPCEVLDHTYQYLSYFRLKILMTNKGALFLYIIFTILSFNT
jgi:hypothetical protein